MAEELHWIIFKGLSQHKPFCDSVTLWSDSDIRYTQRQKNLNPAGELLSSIDKDVPQRKNRFPSSREKSAPVNTAMQLARSSQEGSRDTGVRGFPSIPVRCFTAETPRRTTQLYQNHTPAGHGRSRQCLSWQESNQQSPSPGSYQRVREGAPDKALSWRLL